MMDYCDSDVFGSMEEYCSNSDSMESFGWRLYFANQLLYTQNHGRSIYTYLLLKIISTFSADYDE